jgi:hypothetical protein
MNPKIRTLGMLLLVLLLWGCSKPVEDLSPIPIERRLEVEAEPAAPSRQPQVYQDLNIQPQEPDPRTQIGHRFTDPSQEATSAVEKALMWSERYEQLSGKAEQLRQDNTDLQIENNELKMQLSKLQVELDQAQKELADANAFLQDLQLELTQWKSDVLGFRDEIRAAQAAQMQALMKVLRVLGAETIQTPVDMTESAKEARDNE